MSGISATIGQKNSGGCNRGDIMARLAALWPYVAWAKPKATKAAFGGHDKARSLGDAVAGNKVLTPDRKFSAWVCMTQITTCNSARPPADNPCGLFCPVLQRTVWRPPSPQARERRRFCRIRRQTGDTIIKKEKGVMVGDPGIEPGAGRPGGVTVPCRTLQLVAHTSGGE